MVNDAITAARFAERRLWLLHVPPAARAGAAALLALDDRLGGIVGAAREPAIGQLRLAWWRDALAALDERPPPAEPLLQAMAATVVPATGGASLAALAEGWEQLLDAPLDRDALLAGAAARGAALFAATAVLLGGADPRVAQAGTGWALADLARHRRAASERADAADLANVALGDALAGRWPRRLRPIAMLAALARADLAGDAANSPRRAALLWRLRLLGS